MPHVEHKGEVVVTISAEEARDAIEQVAWRAVVDAEPSIAVEGKVHVAEYGPGYRVTFTRKN